MRRSRIAIIISIAALIATTTAASAAEIQLAGIKLGRSALSIIQKYGNPTEVRVGARTQQQTGGLPGMDTPPGGMPGFGMDTPPGMGMDTPPGMGGPAVNNAGNQQNQAGTSAREITWVYRFEKNTTLEFIIDPQGRILQIAAFGVEWPGLKTAKGITLGDSYKKIILNYGFPESHEQSGIQMITKYANSDRVAFTLVGNQVVGITIAFMD